MEEFIRDIQIDLIMDNPNPIIDVFNGICKDLFVIETDAYHNNGGEFIYYNSKNEWIFFRDDKNDIFWCNCNTYWSAFDKTFNLNYQQIQDLTKCIIEYNLNIRISIPRSLTLVLNKKVKDVLNKYIKMPNVKKKPISIMFDTLN